MPSKVACKSPKDAAFEENPKQNPSTKESQDTTISYTNMRTKPPSRNTDSMMFQQTNSPPTYPSTLTKNLIFKTPSMCLNAMQCPRHVYFKGNHRIRR
jgi:hypothetical protein